MARKSGIAKSYGRHFPTSLAATALNDRFAHALDTSPQLKEMVEEVVVKQGYQFCIGEPGESFSDALQTGRIQLPADLKDASTDTMIGEIIHRVALMSINSEIYAHTKETHLEEYLQVKCDILFTEHALLDELTRNDPYSIEVDFAGLHDKFRRENTEFAGAFDAFWEAEKVGDKTKFPIFFDRPYASSQIRKKLIADDSDFVRSANTYIDSQYPTPAEPPAPASTTAGEAENIPKPTGLADEVAVASPDVEDARKGFFEAEGYKTAVELFSQVHKLDLEEAESLAQQVMQYAKDKLGLTHQEAVDYVLLELPNMEKELLAQTSSRLSSTQSRQNLDLEDEVEVDLPRVPASPTGPMDFEIPQTPLPDGMTRRSPAQTKETSAAPPGTDQPKAVQTPPATPQNSEFTRIKNLWQTGNIWKKD